MQAAVAVRAVKPGWINRRTILGAVLVAISLGGGHTILRDAKASTGVWVAGRDLATGTVLHESALRIEYVRVPPRVAGSYVPSDRDLAGYVVTRPIAQGELIPANWVSDAGAAGTRSITVPLDPEHAVGGALRPGDLIDVLATFDGGEARARTVALVRGVEVIDVVAAGGLVIGEKTVVGVTVSVTAAEAQRVAFASRSAEIDVVRIDGSPGRHGPSVVTEADF